MGLKYSETNNPLLTNRWVTMVVK